jgi:hypothetical protein
MSIDLFDEEPFKCSIFVHPFVFVDLRITFMEHLSLKMHKKDTIAYV